MSLHTRIHAPTHLHALTLALTLSLSLVAGQVIADSVPVPVNQVNLSASASREVVNDLLHVSLFVEHRDQDPVAVNQVINEAMTAALARVAEVSEVRYKTGSYSVNPIYNHKSPERRPVWHGRQQLLLESDDVARTMKLVATLQGDLQISNVAYSIKSETREQVVDELIVEAMKAFHRRAKVVAGQMPSQNYEIGELHISDGGARPVVMRQHRAMVAESSMMAKDAGPAVAAGTSRLEVSVSGSVRY